MPHNSENKIIIFFESPKGLSGIIDRSTIRVSGWIASMDPIAKVSIRINKRQFQAEMIKRVDVENKVGDQYTNITGFQSMINFGEELSSSLAVDVFTTDNKITGSKTQQLHLQSVEHSGNEKSLIFLHVPKTAGTTFSSIIERIYQREEIYPVYTKSKKFHDIHEFRALSDSEKSKIKVLYGHILYGIHNMLPLPAQYITFLRDPVARVISLYNHIVSDKNHPYHNAIMNNNMEISDFVKSGINVQTDNHQTRMLSGSYADFGMCGTDMLEQAKRNIRENILVTGFTERFDETLVLIQTLLEYPSLFYTIKNVSRKNVAKEKLDSDSLKIIKKYNEFDYEIYDYAMKLFDKKVSELGESFRSDLVEFKRRNKEYQ